MEKTENLSKALYEIQDEVIGLHRNPYTNDLEPVINDDDGFLTIITVGKLFGLATDHKEGTYIKFPEGKTLTEMLKDPVGFNDWRLDLDK